jgi:hypothetical protein
MHGLFELDAPSRKDGWCGLILDPVCLNRLLVEYLQHSRGTSERFLAELLIRYARGKVNPPLRSISSPDNDKVRESSTL